MAPSLYNLGMAILFCRNCKLFSTFVAVKMEGRFCLKRLELQYKTMGTNANIHWTIFLAGELEEALIKEKVEDLFHISPYQFLLAHGIHHKNLWMDLEYARFRAEIRLL